jgi:hypothetical protein
MFMPVKSSPFTHLRVLNITYWPLHSGPSKLLSLMGGCNYCGIDTIMSSGLHSLMNKRNRERTDHDPSYFYSWKNEGRRTLSYLPRNTLPDTRSSGPIRKHPATRVVLILRTRSMLLIILNTSWPVFPSCPAQWLAP